MGAHSDLYGSPPVICTGARCAEDDLLAITSGVICVGLGGGGGGVGGGGVGGGGGGDE